MEPPRYALARAFPGYRHRPGRTPHPRTDPAGHSHGGPEPACPALTAATWPEHDAWRFGIDLFNHGYWWEAHEQWEAAWRATAEAPTRHLLQGLIQLGAALLKWESGNARGRRRLWRRARAHLQAAAGGGTGCGLDLTGLLAGLDEACADGGTAEAGLPPPPTVRLWLGLADSPGQGVGGRAAPS